MGQGRWQRPAGGVSYGTRAPVGEGTGVVQGPLGAFPGALRSEGQSGRGSGEAGEGGLFPRLAESLGSEEQRPGRRLHGAEGRARGGPPARGLEALRAAVAAVRAAGPRFARAAPSSAHELFNCPFLSGLPDGCSWLRPPRPSSRGEGPCLE